MKYIGQLVTGDFKENTMTFEIDGEMILQAGKYSIEKIQVGNIGTDKVIADTNQQIIKVEDYFEQEKGITVDAARNAGAKYTAIDMCRFAKKYHEIEERSR